MSLKCWCPHFCIFFSPASNPIEHQEEADHVVVTTKWHLAQKCIYPNIKVLPASKGFTAQLAIINNACFCSSIVHRDDVMFKQQSNINLLFLFDAPLSPHSFPQLGQCFRIEIRTMPFMPIFAASIDTGNCMLFFGNRKPDRNPISYVRTLTLVLVLYEKLQTHRNGIVSSIQRRRRRRKNALLAKWRPLRQMPPRATAVNFLLQLSSFITK